MNKKSFKELFKKSLEVAATNAESKIHCPVPRTFEIELHGGGYPGIILTPEDALDILYLGDNLFYRIIDITVIAVLPSRTRVFVRASAHSPGTFDKTWNQPQGSGPFKQILAQKIHIKGS